MIHAELRVDLPKPALESMGVVAVCSGDRLKLEVHDPVSRKLLRRNFGLRNPSGSGLSRLVGIAAAELILASWAELAINPQPLVEPEGPAPDPEMLRAARERVRASTAAASTAAASTAATRPAAPPPREETSLTPLAPEASMLEEPFDGEPRDEAPSQRRRFAEHRFRVVAFASRRSFFAYPGALWGAGVRLGAEPLWLVSWAADLSYERGALRSDREYEVGSLTAGGQLFFCYRADPITLRLGGGVRAGFAASSPRDGGSDTRTVAPWGWPLLAVNVAALLSPNAAFEVSAEASYSALPVSGYGDAPKGVWFAAQLGVAIIP